jgi:Aspartyl protease
MVIWSDARMHRLRASVTATLTAMLLIACNADTDDAQHAASPIDVPLTPYIGRLVTVNAVIGQDTARLIFDTGGGQTVINPRVAERAGCAPSGRSVGFRMTGEKIESPVCSEVTLSIEGVVFTDPSVDVWDVQRLLPEGVPPVDGILSLKTIAARPFTLRLAEGRLTLETDASFERQVAGMHLLRSRIATGPSGAEVTVFVRGVASDTGWFLIDSGNLDAVLVAPHMAGAHTLDEGTWQAPLTLNGLPGVAATYRTSDIIYDGALSEEFLRNWTLAFDLRGNAVWAEAGTQ